MKLPALCSSSSSSITPLLKSMHVNFQQFWLDYSGVGAKRIRADYAVPFRKVWGRLGPPCGSNQHGHTLVKTTVRLKTIRKRRKTVNRLLKSASTPSFYRFLRFERVTSVGEFVFECHFLFLSLFWAHCLHMLIIDLISMGWSCRVRILTTVPSLHKRQINKSTPITFFFLFVLVWNWSNDLKCELSWLCVSMQWNEIHLP